MARESLDDTRIPFKVCCSLILWSSHWQQSSQSVSHRGSANKSHFYATALKTPAGHLRLQHPASTQEIWALRAFADLNLWFTTDPTVSRLSGAQD